MKKLALAAAGLVAFAAFSSRALAADPSVSIASKQGLGSYLADGAGRTLYWYTKDSPGTSTCEGQCLSRWPAFVAGPMETAGSGTMAHPGAVAVSEGLSAGDFATITRADGARQTTFRGYPLYYWIGDTAPGDTRGQGVNDVWYVVDPAAFPPKTAP